MPRLARAVFANVPHHITQRGNRREDVFYTKEDYITYLDWLQHYSQCHEVKILAYCLMTNHVHLVVVPQRNDSLHMTLKPLHMRHAQRINKARGWKGHVWQGRFYSAPLDERYMWAAIRYVELNPVRARMVPNAELYSWSSAAAHCGLRKDGILSTDPRWANMMSQIDDWSDWLAEGVRQDEIEIIRRNVYKGLPCGTNQFVTELERISGRSLRFQPQGRPPRKEG